MKTVQQGVILDAYKRALDTPNTTAIYVTFESIDQASMSLSAVFKELEHSPEQIREILEEHHSSVILVCYDIEDRLPEIKESLRTFAEATGIVAFVTPSHTLENAIKEVFDVDSSR